MLWKKNKKLSVLALIAITNLWLLPTALAEHILLKTTMHEILSNKTLLSKKGKAIELYQTKNQDNQFRFFIQSGLHGNEKLPPEFVAWLMKRYIKGESLLNRLDQGNASIDFLLYANPDGVETNNRNNHNNVDLNRNFNVLWGQTTENPGTSSFSEPETLAIKRLFEKRKYTAAVDIHGYFNWIVAPSPSYLLKNTSKKPPTQYSNWIEILKQEMKKLPDYELKTAGGLGDGGAFEDWAFWDQNVMAVCLELVSRSRYLEEFNTKNAKSKNKVDSFVLYEKFIFNTFSKAIDLHKTQQLSTNNIDFGI